VTDAPAPRARRWLVASAALLVLLAVVAYWGSRPQRVGGWVLGAVGSALGLEITAAGSTEYTLRGEPRLVLRDVVARAPGARVAVLEAKRVDISVPWATVRSRGATLDFRRIELDAPRVDLAAMQAWLASRPEGPKREFTLREGLQVRDGVLAGAGWTVEGVALDVPRVLAAQPVAAHVVGRFVQGTTRAPFDLRIDASKPANDADLRVAGDIAFEQPARKFTAKLRANGPLHLGDEIRIAPLRMSMAARYTQDDVDLPFAFALNGPLRIRDGAVALSPAGVALRGEGVVPDVDGRAAFAYSQDANLHLDGTLATWPDAWPALPPPIGQSDAPLPFVLDYAGPFDLTSIARLQMHRDETTFDGRFRLPDVLAWIDAPPTSPLPPLTGTVRTPRLDIAGAILEGVDVRLDDPALDAAP
jgi:hypothetical protein